MEPTQQPTEIDLAQMAAIIDCEGTIAISGNAKRRYHQLHLTVGNSHFELLEWCLARFGGAIYNLTYHKPKPSNYAEVKRWRSQSYAASRILERCLPHFIIKRDQAELAIRFQETYKIKGERVGESERIFREELRQKLSALTRTGPRPSLAEPTGIPVKRRDQGNLFSK